jgi:hypothetical protein
MTDHTTSVDRAFDVIDVGAGSGRGLPMIGGAAVSQVTKGVRSRSPASAHSDSASAVQPRAPSTRCGARR